MSQEKRENRTSGRTGKRVLFAIAAAAAVLAVFLLLRNPGGAGRAESLTLPYELENGDLVVDSLFQYSGDNPDCGNEAGEDIGALKIVNQSGKLLAHAALTVKLADRSVLHFEVTDLPAGESAWVFETANTAYDLENACTKIQCDAEFEDADPIPEDLLAVSVEGMEVTLTNRSNAALSGLTVYCRSKLDGTNLGGGTYAYPVDGIPSGGSVCVLAEDCYVGEVSVVRIALDDQGK